MPIRIEVEIDPDFLRHLVVDRMESGVAATGDAAAYALVWEYGNLRQTKKGPKTTLGVNPCGENAWLTIQAPLGYVGMNLSKYLDAADDIFRDMNLDLESGEAVRNAFVEKMTLLADVCAAIAAQTAPVDTAALAGGIVGLAPGDSQLGDMLDPNSENPACDEWMGLAGRN